MNQIIPAILPKNQTELATKVKKILGHVSYVQIDVCDGIFVPSKTQFQQLPALDEIEYELDLMVRRPENSIEEWIDLQPARIVVHIESIEDPQKLFMALERVRGIIEIGLSISNDTENEVLETYINDCDFIQLMGIAEIGFQHESFDERVLEKIKYFRSKYPELPITIDGAVHAETINTLKNLGVSRFICGSAVFGEGDPVENIEKLESLIK